ncbi:hypothetical protein RhiirC2_789438 [Rhizophagus irregularis]|uniref:Uncharacterized protein n=1 Tax=Rhizophagus irregularis TaxID=588596 RepID=A0A2N1MN60_9GLOM|nr:hypothetical protein RhiirC2_789438 [Rhizophagus irregularis]
MKIAKNCDRNKIAKKLPKSWSFWIDRCLKQKEKERRLKINLKKVKENLNKDKYTNPNRKINQLNLFSGLESLRLNIYFRTNIQGFIP